MEFWNLVFTQFSKDEEGNYIKLEKKNIDTGMGLERLAAIMQNANNLFEVDTIRNILNYICKTAGVEYGKSEKSDISIRVVTDHIRSTIMMVSDGIIPSNEGKGYVLRRLIRRAARHGKLLGISRPFLNDVAIIAINVSKQAYPELEDKMEYIRKVIGIEEERFDATIDQGLNILNDFINEAKLKNEKVICGSMVFKLHDTYGFPFDLTREIAEENGLAVDDEGFREEMDEQKKKAREAHRNKDNSAWGQDMYSSLDKSVKTEFMGYGSNESDGAIIYIIKDGVVVENALEGDAVTVILDKTPFYAENGGQTGDSGYIEAGNGAIRVSDCKKTADGIYLHIGVVEKGIIERGSSVEARIDLKRRMSISRNHTTTHLLQKALKNVLGSHVNQAGSLVEPERLRFDFTHFSAITREELNIIENEVNEMIMKNMTVDTREMGIEEARKLGAMALFGEKYGNVVRVVRIGDYTMELCGGTHISTTSQAALVKILGESGVAAGVRRIEAVTGEAALNYFNEREKLLSEVAAALKTSAQDSVRKVELLNSDIKNAEKEIEKLRNKLVSNSMDEVLSAVVDIKGVKVVTARFDQLDMEALRNTSDSIKSRLGTGVVVLATGFSGKVGFVVTATKDVIDRGIHSGNIVGEIAKITGGGGGGRADMAQAGGRDALKINEALQLALKVVEKQLTV